MPIFGKKQRGSSSDGRPSKVAKKEMDEWKHSGLPAGAKNLLKKARKHMGTAECPCRSEDIKATMDDLRAGRYGVEPGAAIIKQRVVAMLADTQTNLVWNAFTSNEHGGLDSGSAPWQVSAAWQVLGDIFVMFWAVRQGATQASTVALDFDAIYQAVTAVDPSDAVTMWDGKSFVNGAPSPATRLVRAAAAAAVVAAKSAEVVVLPTGPLLREPRGGRGGGPVGGPRPFINRGCNYCRSQRKVVDLTHDANTCPHNPWKK